MLEAAATPGAGRASGGADPARASSTTCARRCTRSASASQAMRDLPLEEHGLEWVQPDVPLAHPLDGGRSRSAAPIGRRTADGLGRRRPRPTAGSWARWSGRASVWSTACSRRSRSRPAHPVALARYGLVGIRSARGLVRSRFATDGAGAARRPGGTLHALAEAPVTAGLRPDAGACSATWSAGRSPRAARSDRRRPGVDASSPTAARSSRRTGSTALDELPPAAGRAARPHARGRWSRSPATGSRLATAGRSRGSGTARACSRSTGRSTGRCPGPTPRCARAGTVHVGGTLARTVAAEGDGAAGRHPERPFVLVVPGQRCSTRTGPPRVKHTAWAYCHVPNGSTVDMTDRIEAQVERFAPGFRDRILARHVMGPRPMRGPQRQLHRRRHQRRCRRPAPVRRPTRPSA